MLKEQAVQELERDKNSIENKQAEKIESNYPPFEKDGWKKFYSEGEVKFNDPEYPALNSLLIVDYGKVFNTVLRRYSDDNSFYTGNVNEEGKRHGFGELFYKDGKKYQGHWINNEFMGWGRYIDIEGNLNEGIIYLYY
jgi:hypothetical protein